MYLLDSNIFIQAKNLHYGFDFCPAFWNFLIQQNQHEVLYSIDKVKDEIIAGDDELVNWVKKDELSDFFLLSDVQTAMQFNSINKWVEKKNYQQSAIQGFMEVADYYLIAQAIQRNSIIVTHEMPSASLKKIKIPDVCLGLGIKFITPFVMLRQLHAEFVLGNI